MKLKLFCFLAIAFLFNNGFGQTASLQTNLQSKLNPSSTSESAEMWVRESFGAYNQQTEIIEKRDANSKHFKNNDGTITAVIAAGNMHYQEGNLWKTIFHSIEATQSGFRNTHNSFKTYYPQTATGSIRTILTNGSEFEDMKGMKMYFQAGSNQLEVKTISSSNGSVDFNQLTYPNVYGQGIDLRLTQQSSKRKLDYLIASQSALGVIPANAEWLVFEEKVQIPNGWTAILIGNTIEVKNAGGQVQFIFEKPVFKDSPVHSHEEELNANVDHTNCSANHKGHELIGNYDFVQIGNLLTIKTKVPLSWMLDEGRVYPVIIDPTVNCVPDNAANWTGYHTTTSGSNTYTDGSANFTSTNITNSVSDLMILGRYDLDKVYNSWMKFNINSVPDNACINSASVNYRISYNYSNDPPNCQVNVRLRHMSTDPSVAFSGANNTARLADIRDGDIYQTQNLAAGSTGTGWRSVGLVSNLFHLTNQLPVNWFAVGINSYSGGPHTSCYLESFGHSSTDKPFLAVTYTPAYQVQFSGLTPITFCAGQTQNVSVTVTNVGCMPWTSGGSTPNNVNFSWWGSWQAGNDANPRQYPFSGLAPGASQVVTFSVTAPAAPGSYSIQTDLVRELDCWFRGNSAPSCGPGNIDYIIPITVNPVPIVDGGSNVSMCSGSSTVLNGSGTSVYGNSPWNGSSSPNSGIPDNNATGISSVINIPSTCALASNVTSVSLNITHPFTADLDILLIAPNGSFIDLSSDNGGSGDNYINTVFSTTGSSITTGSAPFTGTFTPEQAFSALTGSAQGNWTLRVVDDASGDVGTLVNWSITLSSSCSAITYSWSPATGLSSATVPNPTASPASTTIYSLTATSLGCSNTDQVTVTVNPVATAPTSVSATHPLHPAYCHGNTVNLTSVGGTAAGGGIVDVWYEHSCNTVVEETWLTTPIGRPGWGVNGTTVNSVNGILNVTSTNVDPSIYLGNLSINPDVYRYVQVRYRYVSGPATPGMQVFFENGSGLAESKSQRGTMIMDGSWHYLNLDMSLNYSNVNSGWIGGGTVTGLRFDFCENTGMVMEFDFFLVSESRMIGDQANLVLNPGDTYYPTTSTQYFTRKIDNCGATSCASTNVNLPPLGTNLSLDGENETCLVNQMGWVHFYHTSGRLIASVNSGGQNLGNVTITSYVEGAPASVPACDFPLNTDYTTAYMQRHWVVTPQFQPATPVQVKLPFNNVEFTNLVGVANTNPNGNDNLLVPNDLKLTKYSGPLNVNDDAVDNCPSNGGSGGATIHTQTGTNVTTLYSLVTGAQYAEYPVPSFSELWLHGSLLNSPLPVELVSLAAVCEENGNDVKVRWTTASELNSSHFTVERSVDGINWIILGTVNAAGNSTSNLNYELIDSDTRGYSVIYYRLNQFDNNGESKVYGPISAECLNEQLDFEVFPNPAGNEVTVLLNGEHQEGQTSIHITDINGKEVKTIFYSEQVGKLISVDLRNLEQGIYIVRLVNGEENNQFVRLIKQ